MTRTSDPKERHTTPDSEVVVCFPDASTLAKETASLLELPLKRIQRHHFPDGESLVRVRCESTDHVLLFCSLDHPNEKIVELLLTADAIRRQGVREITLVSPYLAYMRQDSVFHPGEPLSQHVIAGLLDNAFDEVLTVEAHLHRIRSLSEVFSCRAESLSAAAPIASWLSQRNASDLLVGPDSESEPWIRSIAERAGMRWVVGNKVRRADRKVEIEMPEIPSDVRSAWIIDDIASSGATLETAAGLLKSRGIPVVGAIVVHALFSGDAFSRLTLSGIDPIVSTDSISHSSNAISLAPLLADRISRRSDTLEVS